MSGLLARGLVLRAGRRLLLDGVSVALPRGSVTGIIGPNGAGKSSLLRALTGLAAPEAGAITLDGRTLPPPGTRARARLLGYLPQVHEVHWPLTVRRTVALGRLPHLGPWRRPGGDDERAVTAALERTEMADRAASPVNTLSGGERARVMLARVLVGDTPLILADEPVAALDPRHQLAVMRLLVREAMDGGRAIGIVLHDLSLVARYCDQVILLDHGRVVEAGAMSAVLASPRLRDVYGVSFGQGWIDGTPVITPLDGKAAGPEVTG